jgi:hypothetical protein
MPTPIRAIKDDNPVIDYSFLFNHQPQSKNSKTVYASNKDAELLFNIWTKGERQDEDTYKISSEFNNQDIIRLKTNGFVTGGQDVIKLTRKGKIVITTMALAEPNKFETARQRKNYSEILASMDKRNKPGYRIPKYAANNSNLLNLRRS